MTCESVEMGTETMSISSTLIQACLKNVQKEFHQLEHWLNSLHPPPPPERSESSVLSVLQSLSASIERLSRQYDAQQVTLNHIVDRLDMLEGARDVQINEDPWLDSGSTTLENIVIEPIEPVYFVHKEESSNDESSLSTTALPEVPPAPLAAVEPIVPSVPVPSIEAVSAAPPADEEKEEQQEE